MAPASDVNTEQNRLWMIKPYLVSIECLAFLILSAVVAWKTRQYQLEGQTMPNGKGGRMTISDGYDVAIAFFLISIGWLVSALRFWRRQPTRDSGLSTDDGNA
jgi:hypothetical protein